MRGLPRDLFLNIGFGLNISATDEVIDLNLVQQQDIRK